MNEKPWEYKNIISADHAADIINANIPNIEINDIKLLGEGWDMLITIYVLGFPT